MSESSWPGGERLPFPLQPGRERPLSPRLLSAAEPLLAVAGIARPDVFFEMLRNQGLTLSRCVALPDHAPPDAYQAVLDSPSSTVVCTESA